LRDDKRGEILSNDFKLFCKEYGIRRELTTIETPHQNGIVKQKNWTIFYKAYNMATKEQLSNSSKMKW
jgi:transposase InsO family protein